MSQARQLRVLCSSLALVAVLATGAASARVGQKSQIPAIKAGGCAHDSARQRSASSSDSRTNPASASALSQYDDFIEDVVTAPDICGANLITNDNVAITMGVPHPRPVRVLGSRLVPHPSGHGLEPGDGRAGGGEPTDRGGVRHRRHPGDVDPERVERVGLRCGRPAARDHDRMGSGLWSCAPDHPSGAWEPGELQRRPQHGERHRPRPRAR